MLAPSVAPANVGSVTDGHWVLAARRGGQQRPPAVLSTRLLGAVLRFASLDRVRGLSTASANAAPPRSSDERVARGHMGARIPRALRCVHGGSPVAESPSDFAPVESRLTLGSTPFARAGGEITLRRAQTAPLDPREGGWTSCCRDRSGDHRQHIGRPEQQERPPRLVRGAS